MELSSLYGDEEGDGDAREIPKEYWHDQIRVDNWVERMKDRRKKQLEGE